MRIVGGRYGGRALVGLGRGASGGSLRPTSERVRESLFDWLVARGASSDGTRVLDLFAGTGALGLEALSRGAASVVFVEANPKARAVLKANIDRLDVDAEARVIACDAARLGHARLAPAELVFLDPPYGKGLGRRALAAALAGGWLAPGAAVVWEERAVQEAPPGFAAIDKRRYGDTSVTFLAAP